MEQTNKQTIRSIIRVRDLVERSAGSTKETTTVAEQLSKSYYRSVTVNAPSLP
jgi:hypothetical protein